MSVTPEVLHDVRHDTLELLKELRGVYEDAHQLRLPLQDPIDQYLGVFRNEAEQVEDLTMTVAVIGTMKAGKSTLLNAIVGEEVLPSRELGMTAMPTLIYRKSGIAEPELEIPAPERFRNAAAHLRDKLSSKGQRALAGILSGVGEKDSEVVRRELLGEPPYSFPSLVTGKEEIRKCLALMNDLIRLSQHKEVKTSSPTDGLTTYRAFPQLRAPVNVSFEPRVDPGQLVFVDTPGQNEAGAMNLGAVVRQQLQNASAVILVLNYDQLNEKEAAQLQDQVMLEVRECADRLHVVVNRFDAQDTRSMTAEQVKRFVVKNLLEELSLSEDRVYPISARNALWAIRALRFLDNDGRLPDPNVVPWVMDFGRAFLGQCWEEEIGDIDRVRRCAERGLKDSRFADLRAKVIEHAFANAASGTFLSAFGKISKYAGRRSDLNEVIAIKLATAEESLAKAIETARELEGLLRVIPDVKVQAQTAHDRSIEGFESQVENRKSSLLDEVKMSHFSTEGEVETLEQSTSVLPKPLRILRKLWREAKQAIGDLQPKAYASENQANKDAKEEGSNAYRKIERFWMESCEQFARVIEEEAQSCLDELAKSVDQLIQPFQVKLTAIGQCYGKDDITLELILPSFPRSLHGLDADDFAKSAVIEDSTTRYERRSRRVFGWTLPEWLPDWGPFKETVKIKSTTYRFDPAALERWCDDQIEKWVDDQLKQFRNELQQTRGDFLRNVRSKLATWKDAFEDRKKNEELDANELQRLREGLNALNKRRRALLRRKEELQRGLEV